MNKKIELAAVRQLQGEIKMAREWWAARHEGYLSCDLILDALSHRWHVGAGDVAVGSCELMHAVKELDKKIGKGGENGRALLSALRV